MPKSGTSAIPAARCPRCGYDLTGHIAAWTDHCPTQGQCSECGLAFEWANLLNSRLQDLPWLYEHAHHWLSPKTFAATAVRALIPWRFWAHVRLHHRVCARRLLLYVVLPLLLTYAASVIIGAVSSSVVWIANASKTTPVYAFSQTNHRSLTTTAIEGTTVVLTHDGVSVSIPEALNPTALPQLHDTAIGPVLVFNEFRTGDWQLNSFDIPIIPFIDPDALPPQRRWVSPDGVVQPFGLIAIFIYQDQSQSSGSWPESMASVLLDPIGARQQNSSGALMKTFYDYPGLDPTPILMLGYLAVAVAILLAAPSEWRRARVRRIHLLRIAAYSLTPMFAVFALLLVAHTWAYVGSMLWDFWGQASGRAAWAAPEGWYVPPHWIARFATDRPSYAFIALIMLWTPVYWWFAFTRGIKLRHAGALWFFVTLGGLLAVAVLMVLLVSPYHYWRVI